MVKKKKKKKKKKKRESGNRQGKDTEDFYSRMEGETKVTNPESIV